MRKQSTYTVLFLFVAVIVPVALAIGSPGEGSKTPVILSATVDGDLLVIRGADLAISAENEPFVTLSGEPLRIYPGFSEFELRAHLPRVPQGSYLLTVAADRHAAQAGIFSVSLAKNAREPTSHVPQPLLICANKRHMRVVTSRDKCKPNETFASLQTEVLSDSGDSDDDTDADGDSDADDGDGDDDTGDSDADSDDDSDDGNGRGNGNGNGRGNGSDDDSDSDD